nr:hypothetical protein [Mycobacterium sp. 155]
MTDATGFPLTVAAFEGNRAETATMLPVINAFKTTLTYRTEESNGPRRITLHPVNPDDAAKFQQAIGIRLENFAFFEYDGQVTVGVAQPANTTRSFFAGYNRMAANDLVTQWSPPLPAVLP